MSSSSGSSDTGVVDILYAVALGEGFFAAIYGIKEELVAGQFQLFGAGGQTLLRILLGFLIIIVSWLYYRRAVIPGRSYPTSEFALDVAVMISYMGLLSFADWPAAFYLIVSLIWLLYLSARIASRQMNSAYLVFGLLFVAYFGVASASSFLDQSYAGEWLRFALVTVGVVAYRLLDLRLRARYGFDS